MVVFFQAGNPIHQREIVYQQRSFPLWLRHERKIVIAALLILFAVGATYSTRTRFFPTQIWIVWAIHAAVSLRAIVAGSSVISREYAGQTWESLVLTGISARQIIFGKWRAVLRRVWGWGVVLAVAWLGMTLLMYLNIFRNFRYPNRYETDGTGVVLGVAMALVLTVLEVLGSTALGIAAGALLQRHAVAAIVASTVRFLPVFLFGFGAFVPMRRAFPMGMMLFGLADSGTSATMNMMLPGPFRQWNLLSLGLATLLLVVFLAGAVIVGLKAIQRYGALPHNAT